MRKLGEVGKRYNFLTVIEQAETYVSPKGKRAITWRCRCDCGNEIVAVGTALRRGRPKSCGCYTPEAMSNHFTRHGGRAAYKRSPEYSVWISMRARCHRPTNIAYYKYGAKGIKVCDRWRYSFESFLADMGPRPSLEHSIDRYPDRHGDYEPGNCRWATRQQQRANQDRVILKAKKDQDSQATL